MLLQAEYIEVRTFVLQRRFMDSQMNVSIYDHSAPFSPGSRALNGVITVRELPCGHAPSVQPVSIQEERLQSPHCPPVDVTERRHN